MATTRRWSRHEAMLVFRLYCELPFGQMDHRNDDVIRVADLIQRTPSSVAIKLANFAHLDPAMRARGIRGMANVSALDREIAEQFATNWEDSVEATSAASMVAEPDETLPVPEDIPTEARIVARVRLTQSFFRRTVLASYDFTCSACGISRPALQNRKVCQIGRLDDVLARRRHGLRRTRKQRALDDRTRFPNSPE